MTRGNKHSKVDEQNMERLKQVYAKVFSHAELKTVYVDSQKSFKSTVAALKEKLKLEPINVNLGSLKRAISEDTVNVQKFVADLFEREQKKPWTNKFKTVDEVKLRFVEDEEYGVSEMWIDHLYEICGKNLAKTAEVAVIDRVIRCVIKGLYAIRKNLKHFEKEFSHACYNSINVLVRRRNVALDYIELLKPAELKFELHWFTIDGAESFVEEILKEVLLRPNGGQEEVQFITGRGFHSSGGRSSIKTQLLQLHGKKIRVCQRNSGILLYTSMLQNNVLPHF